MEIYQVSHDVYSAVKKFTKNDIIGKEERQAIELIMSQDGIDAQETQILSNLDNQIAFGITDGKRTTELNPQEISFPPKSLVQQADADKNDPVRAQMYQDLMAAGIEEADITATFTYLDKSGVRSEDMAELVKNQLGQLRHDNPVYRPKDVLGAMQAYGVIQESLQRLKELPEPNQTYLQSVAQELQNGNYHISISSDIRFDNAAVQALADPEADLIIQPGFDIGNAAHRAIMLHELVHASHDVEFNGQEHLGVTSGFSEVEAHLAQGLYLLAARENDEYYPSPSADEAPVVAFADSYREHIRSERAADAASPPDPALSLKARQAYETFSAHEDRFIEVDLKVQRGYAGSFLRDKYADGISHKPTPP